MDQVEALKARILRIQADVPCLKESVALSSLLQKLYPYAIGGLVAATGITFAFSRYELRQGKGIKVSEWLLAKGIDTVYTPKEFEGKCPGYVFSDAGVDVMLTGDQNLAAIQHKIKKKTDEVPHQNHELKGEKRDD